MILLLPLLALSSIATAQADPQPLLPGDKAPTLKVAKYYQGTEIKAFETGKVYVVEFWATWCGPCIDVIPHLNDLSKKLKGKAEFVGVNIWDDEAGQDKRIQDFLKKMGDKMTYRVAVDGKEMHMTSKWMEASISQGIPTAFIVDQAGKIAWIGHPGGIDEPLNQVIAKKFDVAKARQERQKEVAEALEMQRLYEKITAAQELYKQGKKAEAMAQLDELAKTPIAREAALVKISILATDDVPGAKKEIEALAAKDFEYQAGLAFFTIEQATEKNGNRELALFTAETLLKRIKRDDPVILYYISPAYSVNKDHKKAVEILERALKGFDTIDEYKGNPSMKSLRDEIETALKKERALVGN
jgi:thiol-disulfide isomerase/thioredoxin